MIFSLSWAALMLIFLSAHPALGSYEPLAMMFSLDGLGIQWYILPATLLGSLFVTSFWCRMFCPVGLYLNEMVRLRRNVKQRLFPRRSGGGGGSGGDPVVIVPGSGAGGNS
jgi:polyferredoxin